jgi:mono/diheme cytochrome c family protein
MKGIASVAVDVTNQQGAQTGHTQHTVRKAKASGLLAVLAASVIRGLSASEVANTDRWNVMVVPSCQTVYSQDARERFNRYCAGCHGKDGRAQTPVARQRHVRDLSECKLNDDGIVKQILGGTRDKTNTFKMPPFVEKLSRTEAETLVPLVKSFRPASATVPKESENAHQGFGPRLAGIVSFPGNRYAVLERTPNEGNYFVLTRWESHEGTTLEKLDLTQGNVRIRLAGENSVRTLKFDTTQLRSDSPQFLNRLFGTADETRHQLILENVSPDLFLFLYGQVTGCTLLRSPRLPETSFTITATAKDRSELIRIMDDVLTSKGITVVPDGKKFLKVLPSAEALPAQSNGEQASNNERNERVSNGIFMNLPGTRLSEALKSYAELSGRKLEIEEQMPALEGIVKFTTYHALNANECEHALKVLLGWRGLRMVSASQESLRITTEAKLTPTDQ